MNLYQLTQNQLSEISMPAESLDDFSRALPDSLYSTFSTMRSASRVFGLAAHLRRLYPPGHVPPPAADETQLRKAIAQLVKQNLPNESRARIMRIKQSGSIYIGIQAFTPLPESIYAHGVHVVTAELIRENPLVKDTHFIAQSAELRKKINKNVFEVLLTKNQRIYEGMTSNFYALKGDVLITARTGILLGVTRKIVIQLAKGQGLRVQYQHPRMDAEYDEAFLTSSSRGVVPIVQINESTVGQGSAGKWARALQKAYQSYIHEKSEVI